MLSFVYFFFNIYNYDKKLHFKYYKFSKFIIFKMKFFHKKKIYKYSKLLINIIINKKFFFYNKTLQILICLIYLSCKRLSIPVFLSDFSSMFNLNIFDIGSTYIRVCRVLKIKTIISWSIYNDPSLFLNKYISSLQFGNNSARISNLALKLVFISKNEWKKKNFHLKGIYGASIFLAALSYGYKKNFNEIKNITNVGTTTLRKRLNDYHKLKNSIKNKIVKYKKYFIKKNIKKNNTQKKIKNINFKKKSLYKLIPGVPINNMA
uniref:TFIIIB related factor hBRF n=1 Tax=Lotharella vacuolata TaxID=74820 RepID=A0A0H5BHI9_9EUKA|nr:TFIIIB related factor hBRF [Lotharella vacuolata]